MNDLVVTWLTKKSQPCFGGKSGHMVEYDSYLSDKSKVIVKFVYQSLSGRIRILVCERGLELLIHYIVKYQHSNSTSNFNNILNNDICIQCLVQ